jgi:glucokinase
MKLYIDVGGTYLRSELHTGEEVMSARVGAASVDLSEYIEAQIREFGVPEFIGIAFAGQVSGGRVHSAPNVSLKEPAIKAYFESRYDLRLEIENDLGCAVMAEANRYGATDIVALYAGTGLGSGVVCDGKLLRGSGGFAAEIGHVPYREAPFTCGCGKRNCLELYASGSGLAKWLEYNGMSHTATLEQLRDGTPEQRKIVSAFEMAWLHAAATLVTLYNPARLVLGGGIVAQNPYLERVLAEELGNYALKASLEGLEITVSDLVNAPLEGAKLLERNIYG